MSCLRGHSKEKGAVVIKQNQIIVIYTSVAIFTPIRLKESSVTLSTHLPLIYTFPLDHGARELS